jgi:PAS domain S-box-containing protein
MRAAEVVARFDRGVWLHGAVPGSPLDPATLLSTLAFFAATLETHTVLLLAFDAMEGGITSGRVLAEHPAAALGQPDLADAQRLARMLKAPHVSVDALTDPLLQELAWCGRSPPPRAWLSVPFELPGLDALLIAWDTVIQPRMAERLHTAHLAARHLKALWPRAGVPLSVPMRAAEPELVRLADAERRCVHLSESWTSYLGIASVGLFAEVWSERVHPEDRELLRQASLRLSGGAATTRVVYRLRCLDGVYRSFSEHTLASRGVARDVWYLTTTRELGTGTETAAAPEPSMSATIFNGMEPQQRMAAAMQVPAAVSAALDALPVALVTVQSSGCIDAANRSALRVFGLDHAEQLLGQPLEAWLPGWRGESRGRSDALDPAAGLVHGETIGRRADGSRFDADVIWREADIEQGGSVLVAISDVSWRQQAQRALERALKEKTALLSEVHHRVKNNLQVMSSLLSLQAHACAEPEARAVLVDSQRRVTTMGLTHQLLYEHGDLSHVDLADYLDRLVRLVLETLEPGSQRIALLLDLAPATLVLRRCVPFGLLVNELVTNAVKHAYPDGRAGLLRLRLHHQPGRRLLLSVCDDGVGLPDDYQSRARASLGGQLIAVLAEQIGASVQISRSSGTTFDVTFPMDAMVSEEPCLPAS